MDLATATPYRAPTFHAPRGPSADDLVEVIVSWGDVVLSVTYVRAGEGFAWEGASVLRATAEGWAVTPPEGASAWALREGEAAVEALVEGAARVLAADERVCVALGEVTLRLARTAPPEAFPRARGAVGFAAGVAFLFALVATGLAIAAAPEDDGTLARDDAAGRAWLAARIRPYAEHAPEAAPTAMPFSIVPLCCRHTACWHRGHGPVSPLQRDDFSGEFEEVSLPVVSSPEAHRMRLEDRYADAARIVGVSVARPHAERARRVVLRHIREVSFCRQRHGGSMRPGRLAMRYVSGATGSVLGVAVASSTLASPALEDCVAAAIRRWDFGAPMDGAVVVGTVTFSIR